jgi:membrane-associated PAP2 superfamily phosphatase
VSVRSRYLWFVGGWTVLVALLMVAIPLTLRTRLPDPIAVEWASSGAPESSSSLRDFLFGKLVWWLVVAGVWSAFGFRGVLRRRGLAWAGAALGVFGALMLGTVVLTTVANLDAPDFRHAAELTGEGWLLLAGPLAGWLGWRLGSRSAPEPAAVD